ncbi:homocysteine S-methyltransferase 1 isoform X1 [Cottoperca gobio]|uniref:Homocysteine S-methyltransferase 1 isoform X1 n=1 Tax=Cottoperca gobio TaxID=56716 RepID=A0A6J2PJK8_COTGO|nr:homocysteine S-methyltransferase 1-like isoform X1 [Cottoperca gobio]
MGSSARLRPYMNDNGPLILDGGLATELEAQGFKLQGDPLWSARLLHTDPQAIREAHYRFLLSGADVITTATYQASISGFIKHLDVSSERARELLMSGVHLAKESVDRFVSDTRPAGPRRPLVAGSVGPYGAFLLDGSEYTGDYAAEMSVEGFKVWHRPQIECLAAAGVDLVAFETIPSLKEAQALLELLREFPNTNAWLSFSCRDGQRISDGGAFKDAVQIVNRSTQLVAVGVNCCSPELLEPLLASAGSLRTDASWVVYPNSGEDWDSEHGWRTSEKASASIPALSHTWMKQGAALIGTFLFKFLLFL